MALQIAPDELVPLVAELFHDLLDYTVPVVSLIKGERIARNIARMFADLDVRDIWLPFFCVSTNLTRSRVEVHDRRRCGHGRCGPAWRSPGSSRRCRSTATSSSTAACSTTCRAT